MSLLSCCPNEITGKADAKKMYVVGTRILESRRGTGLISRYVTSDGDSSSTYLPMENRKRSANDVVAEDFENNVDRKVSSGDMQPLQKMHS